MYRGHVYLEHIMCLGLEYLESVYLELVYLVLGHPWSTNNHKE